MSASIASVPQADVKPMAPVPDFWGKVKGVRYPEDNGEPLANNTVQLERIVSTKTGFDGLYRDRNDVFVAADLLWYPVEGNNQICAAPDVMIVFGRPKGDRGSYLQWLEDNIPPQVVFEILSPGNRAGEMERKLHFYEQYGVEEYYLYDPSDSSLSGWLRRDHHFRAIESMLHWVSPRTGVRFALEEDGLVFYRPDGAPFETYLELLERAESADLRAESAEQRAENAEQRVIRLAAQLRALGIEPDEQ